MDPFAPQMPPDPMMMQDPAMGGGMGMPQPQAPIPGISGGSIDDSIQRGDALAELLRVMLLERMQARKEAALRYQKQQAEANSMMFGG